MNEDDEQADADQAAAYHQAELEQRMLEDDSGYEFWLEQLSNEF